MNNAMKRTGNVVLLGQRIELFSETVTPEAGQGTAQIDGRRAMLDWLMAGVKALWTRKETNNSPPGRDPKEMVLTYASDAKPDRDEVTSCAEAHRRCSGI